VLAVCCVCCGPCRLLCQPLPIPHGAPRGPIHFHSECRCLRVHLTTTAPSRCRHSHTGRCAHTARVEAAAVVVTTLGLPEGLFTASIHGERRRLRVHGSTTPPHSCRCAHKWSARAALEAAAVVVTTLGLPEGLFTASLFTANTGASASIAIAAQPQHHPTAATAIPVAPTSSRHGSRRRRWL